MRPSPSTSIWSSPALARSQRVLIGASPRSVVARKVDFASPRAFASTASRVLLSA